ncbi:UNVERIFIED_CONTAM: hypothetical protein ABID98_001824 [Brevibacillus sp. OAP136]
MFEEEDHQLHVFDIVSKKTFDLEGIVHHLISDSTEMIHFSFMPKCDYENIQSEPRTEWDDILFVRPNLIERKRDLISINSTCVT